MTGGEHLLAIQIGQLKVSKLWNSKMRESNYQKSKIFIFTFKSTPKFGD